MLQFSNRYVRLCSAAQMCLTSLTTCNSIHATAPHTRRDARYKCFEVANYGGVRTYALHTPIDWRKLVALPATTQAQPRRSRGCESPFSASSPSILARCCCRRRQRRRLRRLHCAANGRHDIPSTRCATPFMASIARTSFPDSLPSFFSADERRCAAHVDSLTLHDTISIDL